MNQTPDHLSDEILSALLDGDDSAELGVDAAAHLRACDRCSGRQAELAGARAALAAAPVEPLDELTRRRLVAGALQAAEEAVAGQATAADGATAAPAPIGRARARWAQRHPAVIGSAAAVVLAVLVGVPFVLGNDKSQEHTALSARAPEAALESAGSFLGDLGDLTDRENLRLRLSGAAANDTFAYGPLEPGPSPAAGAPAAAPVPGGALTSGGLAGASTTTASPPAAGRSTSGGAGSGSPVAKSAAPERASGAESATADEAFAGQAASRDRADTDACVAALLNGPARGGRVTRSGTGTYRSRPAIVVAFELSGGTEAFVADRAGCAVLDRFSV